MTLKHFGLFEGIGGFSLAALWMGWETIGWCEWSDFCQKILKYYFPKAKPHGDITKENFKEYANKVDILTGGFPCQPFSNSGEQLGPQDERYLFEEMLRAIREIKPRWIVAENVFAITSPKFSEIFEHICSSLEAEGYEVQPFIIPATAIEAEHERNRVWIIAHANSARFQRQGGVFGSMQPEKIGNRKTSRFVDFIQRNSMPFLCSSHDGLPRKLADLAVHGAGNAIVPQIAFEIFKTIEDYENL